SLFNPVLNFESKSLSKYLSDNYLSDKYLSDNYLSDKPSKFDNDVVYTILNNLGSVAFAKFIQTFPYQNEWFIPTCWIIPIDLYRNIIHECSSYDKELPFVFKKWKNNSEWDNLVIIEYEGKEPNQASLVSTKPKRSILSFVIIVL